MFLTSYSWTHI